MAAAGRRLIGDSFAPQALAEVLEASYEGGVGVMHPRRNAALAGAA